MPLNNMKKFLLTIFISLLLPATALAAGGTLGLSNNTSTLTSGLVGYWSMDGNKVNWLTGVVTDSSGQNNNGHVVNMSTTTSPTTGKVGGALQFNGSNNYVDTGTGVLSGLNNLTVSYWIYYRTGSGNNGIWSEGDTQNQSNTFEEAGRILFHDNTKATQSWSVNPFTANVWQHIVVVRTPSSITVYKNGVLFGSNSTATFGPVNTADVNFRIGMVIAGSSGAQSFTPSTIDDFRVYNRVLSIAEIKQLYTTGLATVDHSNTTTLQTGLVGYWPLDGNTTNWKIDATTDVSGNGNLGRLINLSTTTSPIAGKIGGALKFNGVNQYISGAIAGFNSTQISVCAWASKSSNPSTFTQIVGDADVHGALFIDSSGVVFGQFSFVTGGNKGTFATKITMPSGLHHYCTTWSTGNPVNLYRDGSLVASSANVTDTLVAWTGFWIARYSGGVYFNGTIDDARVYNRALSAQEVQQLYATGVANIAHSNTVTLSSGLVGYWTFDGPNTNWKTDTVVDSSGQGNTGQMVSMSTSTSPTAGKIGQALKFNGTNSSINVPNSSSLQLSNAITVSAWIYGKNNWTHPTEGSTIVAKRDFTSSDQINYDFEVNKSGFLQFLSANGSIASVDNTTALSINKWYFVSVTYDSSNVRFYVNGTQVSSFAQTAAMASNTTLVSIGRTIRPHNTNFGEFQGNLDDVRIYNRALSAQEVSQLYNLGK